MVSFRRLGTWRSRSNGAIQLNSGAGSRGSVQVNRSMGKSLCDEMVPDSPLSISSELCESQVSEDHEGIADELLLSSSSSSTACETTIVVSTAECERSFSALKRIKSYLRSTMSTQ